MVSFLVIIGTIMFGMMKDESGNYVTMQDERRCVQSYHFLRECGYRYRGWQCISVAEYLILIVPVSWRLVEL
jgi:hypothetical protein